MLYRENALQYEDYCELRTSVEWPNYNKEQVTNALKNNQYDVVVFDENIPIAMGQLVNCSLI